MKVFFRCLLPFCCLILLSGLATAQEWGEVREAVLNLNVRAKRGLQSTKNTVIFKGQRVKVDFEKNGWVAIFHLNETVRDESKALGYANAKYLKPVENAIQSSNVTEKIREQKTASPSALKPIQSDANLPVQIASDSMVYDEKGRVVTFKGNVVAEHGALTLWAETLSAFLSKEGATNSSDSIERIVARGNVRAKKGNSVGTCGKLTYFVKREFLKMEKSPKLTDGRNSLVGDVINYSLRNNRSEVVGGQGKRVKAVFIAPQKGKGR